jgi:hypothetical protein
MALVALSVIFWPYFLLGALLFIISDIHETYTKVKREQEDIAEYREMNKK